MDVSIGITMPRCRIRWVSSYGGVCVPATDPGAIVLFFSKVTPSQGIPQNPTILGTKSINIINSGDSAWVDFYQVNLPIQMLLLGVYACTLDTAWQFNLTNRCRVLSTYHYNNQLRLILMDSNLGIYYGWSKDSLECDTPARVLRLYYRTPSLAAVWKGQSTTLRKMLQDD